MDYTSFSPGRSTASPPSLPGLPSPKTFTPKFIALIVSLFVLGGAAYAGLWYWQNQQAAHEITPTFTPRADEMAGWKTYTNTHYGYSISYPAHYSITTTDSCGNGGCELREPTSSSYEVTIERPAEAGVSNEAKRDVLIISLNKKSQEYFSVAPGEQPLSFMGYKAKVAENTAGELQTKSLVIDRGDYIFHVSAEHNRTNGGVSFDILSTFKFTGSSDTSTWKTYTSTQYGFEVKYPGDWTIADFNSYGFDGGIAIRSLHSNTEVYPLAISILIKLGSYQNSRKAFEDNILPDLRKDIDHEVGDIKFNGYDAISFTDLGMADTKNIVFIQDGSMIEISYTPDQRDIANISQILSTFKFTK